MFEVLNVWMFVLVNSRPQCVDKSSFIDYVEQSTTITYRGILQKKNYSQIMNFCHNGRIYLSYFFPPFKLILHKRKFIPHQPQQSLIPNQVPLCNVLGFLAKLDHFKKQGFYYYNLPHTTNCKGYASEKFLYASIEREDNRSGALKLVCSC
jgi:hypothetical protein